ncbi:hypothetical protein OJ996_16740 [Luteolibacter sp. GHJ8]|uniref:Uncharacterized protein n=1 Tax=Luteolibacter rhizosphaerae TaxID=2989719 RepID=A0ABT3G5W7_9BACT|nr:hypothetical protein [Luteolibacter rhizosphaerae]MCW1915236.1 hypothetical protein [Luteolibacter rhizosphaerae]
MTSPFNFGQRFIESKGQPIAHGASTVQMIDRFPAKLGEELEVTIESTASLFRQGVGFSEGVEVFGERQKKAVVFEHFSVPPEERESVRSRLPFTFTVTCRNRTGFVQFYNMALVSGRQEWWHGGSAMIVEEVDGGRRYRCNDFELDDDFNDLIFTVKPKSPTSRGRQPRGLV